MLSRDRLDLAIGRAGAANQLLLNQGNLSNGSWAGFGEALALPGDGSSDTSALAFADVNQDGWWARRANWPNRFKVTMSRQ